MPNSGSLRLAHMLLLVASALGVLAAPIAARAQEEPPAEDPTPAEPEGPRIDRSRPGVQWFTNLSEAFATARERRELLLVYIARHAPPDPQCEKLEREILQTREARQLSDRCVTVRVLFGLDTSRAASDFMKRYGIVNGPTLLVMNPKGHVVWGAGTQRIGRSVQGIIKAIETAKALETEFAASALLDDPVGRRRHAERLIRRMAWEELEPIYRSRVKRDPSVDNLSLLAQLYRRTNQLDRERAALDQLVAEHTGHPDRVIWQLRIAAQPFEAAASRAEAAAALPRVIRAVRDLQKAIIAEGNKAAEPRVRYQHGYLLAASGEGQFDAATEQFDAILKTFPDSNEAAPALRQKAELAWRTDRVEDCRALLLALLKRYPKSPLAAQAMAGVRNCDARLLRERSTPQDE